MLLLAAPEVDSAELQASVAAFRAKVGDLGKVDLERLDRLAQVNLVASEYDKAVSGLWDAGLREHTDGELAQIATALKPGGMVHLREPAGSRDLGMALMLSGYVNQVTTSDATVTVSTFGSRESSPFATGNADYEAGVGEKVVRSGWTAVPGCEFYPPLAPDKCL